MSATQLPIRLRNHHCYGELVREIRLSMLPGRWDKVDYTHMLMFVGSCTNLKLLDMNLCGNMRSSELVGLFLLCPSVCLSLEYLDICETGFSASAITRVLQLMPNLQHLDISDTDADDDLLVVVSQSNQKLTYLAVAGCINVSNMGIKAVVESCTKLEVVDIAECPFIDDYAFLEANNIKLEIDSERDSNGYMP
ncbi:hypothetical protein IW148_000502 [Coemansia sp. RSA 1199]|nr:hypothetical protein IW148_000502 [Coemansia sp. RSA 1199]